MINEKQMRKSLPKILTYKGVDLWISSPGYWNRIMRYIVTSRIANDKREVWWI